MKSVKTNLCLENKDTTPRRRMSLPPFGGSGVVDISSSIDIFLILQDKNVLAILDHPPDSPNSSIVASLRPTVCRHF